jgi:hypothetical protein
VKGRIDALEAADPGNTAPGAGRPGDGVVERPRPAHQPGRGAVSARARGARRGHVRGDRASARGAAHARATVGSLRRARRRGAAAQPRAGRAGKAL